MNASTATTYSHTTDRPHTEADPAGEKGFSEDVARAWEAMRSGTTFGDDWARFGAAKLFSDGSLGAQTAWLAEPYADAPSTRGVRTSST